ncbi:MAG: nucleoside triphosphate pyrophosphohydrolase [Candidatus Dormibacter sp.]|uniref:nucleoside triphosphate pyrophosphohydrolase n=1 Tax=Candidatus Dormibacter sp. TaxID=2973982 RepID=UPI0026B984F7
MSEGSESQKQAQAEPEGGAGAAAQRPYPQDLSAVFQIARRLRAQDGCPWDRQQTHASLRPYLLEEAYELLEVLDQGDEDLKLREELGDVLLQVAMHAAIAEEEGRFDASDVSVGAAAKMVARHPHVFAGEQVADAEEVLKHWEERKATEAERAGQPPGLSLDRVPRALPALAWTYNMQKRAARLGFDLESQVAAAAAVSDQANVLGAAAPDGAAERAVGELLFAAVSLARTLKVNPEDALRSAGQRYRDRFAALESRLRADGRSYRELEQSELAQHWDETVPPSH